MPDYGNVSEEDVQALGGAARIAAAVADSLPAHVPPEWHELAYEQTLRGVLKDWVRNGTNELNDEDQGDLSSLIALAADTALNQPAERRDLAFRVLAEYAMEDWVENWNLDEWDEEEVS